MHTTSHCLLILICSYVSTGEWWNGDVDEVEKEMLATGAGPNISAAYTINGLPGPLYPCSNKGSVYHSPPLHLCEVENTGES